MSGPSVHHGSVIVYHWVPRALSCLADRPRVSLGGISDIDCLTIVVVFEL